jgi:hypothetical protein
MARIVTESHPDFVRIVLFIPAVELLGIQELVFINQAHSLLTCGRTIVIVIIINAKYIIAASTRASLSFILDVITTPRPCASPVASDKPSVTTEQAVFPHPAIPCLTPYWGAGDSFS